MAINRYEVVQRHNPVLEQIDVKSALSVGNGEFAFTADVTGMQTLYDHYKEQKAPLCTMSQWGWHTTPVNSTRFNYNLNDLELTKYSYADRAVSYAVERMPGNEEVYDWLRQNPHRFNLGRIGLVYQGKAIMPGDITNIHQKLDLYQGIIVSSFRLLGVPCEVVTCCHQASDTLAFMVESELLRDGALSVMLSFPYGSADITASDWKQAELHQSKITSASKDRTIIERNMDQEHYYVGLRSEKEISVKGIQTHEYQMSSEGLTELSFTIHFSKNILLEELPTCKQVQDSSRNGWKTFWETGGAVDFHGSTDNRAPELERRIVLSQYVSAIHSCGSLPPQETGLICNSWHGKFHLEMYLWHVAWLPLWGRADRMKQSLGWYKEHLKDAVANAARNGFQGAKWPKQVAYDAIDSPSPIATLLIWQQPHIIYLLELVYQCEQREELLQEYWEVVRLTADYMADLAVYNPVTGRYDLVPPLIPAQEEHKPEITRNPTFEVEYWRFGLNLAIKWADRLGRQKDAALWQAVAEKMAELPNHGGCYLAHENCPDTFSQYNKDHPSMLAAYGLIAGDRVEEGIMLNTLEKTLSDWDFTTTWGWDFAMIAMTATRLGYPEAAIHSLMKETPNNHYTISGHNSQKLREDLPVYLPGNGSLLLALALMLAGYDNITGSCPGFPKDESWKVEFEGIHPFPY